MEKNDYKENIYSPVAKVATIKTLLTIVNEKQMLTRQLDVITAFLNGKVDHKVYMAQPPGFVQKNNLVCKLNRAIYGLKKSPIPLE